MKRDKFFDIAEKMYVEQFITEEEIAKMIERDKEISEKYLKL